MVVGVLFSDLHALRVFSFPAAFSDEQSLNPT